MAGQDGQGKLPESLNHQGFGSSGPAPNCLAMRVRRFHTGSSWRQLRLSEAILKDWPFG